MDQATEEWKAVFNTMASPLGNCCVLAVPRLKKLFNQALDQHHSFLLKAARQQQADQDKESLILANQACSLYKSAFKQAFQEQLQSSLSSSFSNPTLIPKKPTHMSNALINDFSVQMMTKSLAGEANRHYAEPWQTISAGIKNLLSEQQCPTNLPFSVEHLCECIIHALNHEEIDALALQQLLNLFQHEMLYKLKPLYQELAQQLKPVADRVSWQSSSTQSSFRLDMVASEPANVKAPVYELDKSIQDRRTGFCVIAETPDSLNEEADQQAALLSDAEVMQMPVEVITNQALNDFLLQQQKAYDPGTDGELVGFIQQQLQQDGGHQLNAAQINTLKLISVVFHQFSPNIPTAAMAFFQRLKIPFARMAIMDELFFKRSEHPARILLDAIVRNAGENKNDAVFTRQLQYTVSKIILRFSHDETIFSSLLPSWLDDASNRNAPGDITQKEAASVIKPDAIQQLIHQRFDILNAPLPFHQLTKNIWQGILQNIATHQGQNSNHWKTALLLLDKTLQLSGLHNAQWMQQQIPALEKLTAAQEKLFRVYRVSDMQQQIFFAQFDAILHQLIAGKDLSSINSEELPQAASLRALLISAPNAKVTISAL